jgi:hypothetical protein
MDRLEVIDTGRGVYVVRYNHLSSREIPFWRIEYYKWRAVNVYHRRWGRGR